MIDAGRYTGRVTGYAFGETGNGDDQLGISVELFDEHQRSLGEYTWYGYFHTEKSFAQTMKTLKVGLGWQGDDVTNLDEVVGVEVSGVIAHETYEGETKARLAFINAPGGVAIAKPLDEGRKASLRDKVRARILSGGAPDARPRAQPAADPNHGLGDDRPPF